MSVPPACIFSTQQSRSRDFDLSVIVSASFGAFHSSIPCFTDTALFLLFLAENQNGSNHCTDGKENCTDGKRKKD